MSNQMGIPLFVPNSNASPNTALNILANITVTTALTSLIQLATPAHIMLVNLGSMLCKIYKSGSAGGLLLPPGAGLDIEYLPANTQLLGQTSVNTAIISVSYMTPV